MPTTLSSRRYAVKRKIIRGTTATAVAALAVTTALAGTALAAPGSSERQGRPSAAVSLGDSYIAGNAARWKGNSADPAAGHAGTDRGTGVYGDTATGCLRSDSAEITGR